MKAAFSAWVAGREASKDPYFYSILDRDGRALGLLSLMAIRPDMRVVEVGNIAYSRRVARERRSAPKPSTCWRDTCSRRWAIARYEWKCDSLKCAVAARRAPLRICLRRPFSAST